MNSGLNPAQAAPGVAAAEETLVPMDDSILAGPANPAIAFRAAMLILKTSAASN
jgi:hypothetical protein